MFNWIPIYFFEANNTIGNWGYSQTLKALWDTQGSAVNILGISTKYSILGLYFLVLNNLK